MPDIIVKDRKGSDVIFRNVAAIQLNTVDGEKKLFTADGGDFIVTYMNDDGSEMLYSKSIMYGDTCGDVIALGLLAEPSKESTDTAEYSFLGWSASVGGTVDNSVFETVTENKTVYAVFNAIIILAKGECGETANWKLLDSGIFMVLGEGDMADYASVDVRPWNTYKSLIKEVTITEGITSVGEFSFRDCTNIKSVNIPDGVTSIDKNAFNGCTGLTSVDLPDSLTTIGYGAFAKCTGITSITIPDSVTSLDQWAFNAAGLTAIAVPGSINKISDNAFNGCKSLKTATISEGVTDMGNIAFAYCPSLTSVSLPDSLSIIGSNCFNGCTALTQITIPKNVTLIRSRAFYGCSNLSKVTFEDTSGWSVATSTSATNWTSVNVTNASTAAQYLRSTYVEYVWKKQ